MIQQKLKLSNELPALLRQCEELWVAVALISDSGFKFIQDHINPTAKQNYIVGIGLPTSPAVLRSLMTKQSDGFFDSKIYHKNERLFHPKAYIIKSKGKLTAFVGSANCSDGGLDKNLELSIKSEDQVFCSDLIKWFNAMFKFGIPITEEFLTSYSYFFEKRIARLAQDSSELNALMSSNIYNPNLDNIDFSNQFFKREHFAAFEGSKPLNTSDAVNQERINVRNRLFRLHDLLYPEIRKQHWDLHEHYVYDDTVSSAIHGQYTSSELGGIWLHYGRDKRSIKAFRSDETPLDFMRLEVIVHKDSIGIWNRVGKDGGSRIDRSYFKEKMTNDPIYRRQFYSIISRLPDDYFITVNEEKKYVREFETENQLSQYVLSDEIQYYFIIGIEIPAGDPRISENNIIRTVIEHFGYLYPTYEIIKYDLRI